jgi:uncharacterized membrane protein
MARPVRISLGWSVALGAVGTLAVLAVLPPFLGGEPGALVRGAFSTVCHQLPDRTPHLDGAPIALCHRCSGILAGLLVGLVLAPSCGPGLLRRIACSSQVGWLLAAGVPTALDWGLGVLGLWANTPASRLATGALFGLVAGGILAANLLAARRPRSLTPSLAP